MKMRSTKWLVAVGWLILVTPVCSQAKDSCEGSLKILARGFSDLKRTVRITSTTSKQLDEAQRALEAIPDSAIDTLTALGEKKLHDRPTSPAAQNNLEHVENQHLKPFSHDAQALSQAFGISPSRLRLLMVLHDLGKVEIPREMAAALQEMFPNDFVSREILSHEYASMIWIERLGRQADLSPREILALQKLIANHNFGPDLGRPGSEELANDWWPTNFRSTMIPALRRLGIDVDHVFTKGPDGQLQYNSSEGNVYSALLSAYDRAIANEYNNDGIATWQKFSQQDYTGWLGKLKQDPSAPTPFSGQSLVARMKISAERAKNAVQAMWNSLAENHAGPDFDLETFAPYRNQIDGISRLQQAIDKVANANSVDVKGQANYTANNGDQYRVVDRTAGSSGKAKLEKFNVQTGKWEKIAEDDSPVKLFFELVKRG